MPDSLYDRDFYAWTQAQAAALRRVAEMRVNLPDVDLDHLAEEVEDLGKDVVIRTRGLIVQIVVHLLKLEHCPDPDPRRHWRKEVTTWRDTVVDRLAASPSAAARLDLDNVMRGALRILRAGERGDWLDDLPDARPYTLDQILDFDWWPENRHGLSDD